MLNIDILCVSNIVSTVCMMLVFDSDGIPNIWTLYVFSYIHIHVLYIYIYLRMRPRIGDDVSSNSVKQVPPQKRTRSGKEAQTTSTLQCFEVPKSFGFSLEVKSTIKQYRSLEWLIKWTLTKTRLFLTQKIVMLQRYSLERKNTKNAPSCT